MEISNLKVKCLGLQGKNIYVINLFTQLQCKLWQETP
jgi:hypothetical protein